MQSKAATVDAYLASLPEDRRTAISAVRDVFLKNLDSDYEEGMQYGMIGYYVPHRVFPAGYHCDPKQPLPFAGLASQKQHMSLYMMALYGHAEHLKWFTEAWKRTGKKLDMGKACIRFKKLDDLALDVIAEALRRVPARVYVTNYQATLARIGERRSKGPAKTPASKAAGGKSAAGKPASAKKPAAAKRATKKARKHR